VTTSETARDPMTNGPVPLAVRPDPELALRECWRSAAGTLEQFETQTKHLVRDFTEFAAAASGIAWLEEQLASIQGDRWVESIRLKPNNVSVMTVLRESCHTPDLRWSPPPPSTASAPRAPGDKHRRAILETLQALGAFVPDAATCPTALWLARKLGHKEANSQFKTMLSELSKLGLIDNGFHHRLRKGYFITAQGVAAMRQRESVESHD
jgi:hypothetical protein